MSTLVVMAAGLATRYGGAKQLEPVGPGGEVLFDYAVYDARRAGCERVVFVIRDALRAAFESSVVPRWQGRLEVELAIQRLDDAPGRYRAGRVKPWGTAHALLTAAAVTADDVLVCNADDFYGSGAFGALAGALRQRDAAHAVAGYPLAHTLSPHGGVTRAVCGHDERGRLTRIDEITGLKAAGGRVVDDRGREYPDDALVSMNLWAFRQPFLRSLPEAFAAFLERHAGDPGAEWRIPDLVNGYVAAGLGEVRVIPVSERWFGMTHRADRQLVSEELDERVRAGAYPASLLAAH